MKSVAVAVLLDLLISVMSSQAQRFPTNSVDASQAIRIASSLRPLMSEDVVTMVLDQNGLKCGGGIGSSIGWTRVYRLSDGCFLRLQMNPRT